MDLFSFNQLELQKEANKIKELIIETLSEEGLLKGDWEDIASDYVITIRTKGLFGSIFDKFVKINDNETQYRMFKTINYKRRNTK